MDKDEYVSRNEALLDSLPSFPGAVQKKVTSAPYYGEEEGPFSQPIGYTTNAVYSVPRGTTAAKVIRFYTTRLEPRGWQSSIEEIPGIALETGKAVSTTLVASFVRRDAYVNVNTDNMTVRTDIRRRAQHIAWTYELAVDYRSAH